MIGRCVDGGGLAVVPGSELPLVVVPEDPRHHVVAQHAVGPERRPPGHAQGSGLRGDGVGLQRRRGPVGARAEVLDRRVDVGQPRVRLDVVRVLRGGPQSRHDLTHLGIRCANQTMRNKSDPATRPLRKKLS